MVKRPKPSRINRPINPKHMRRAERVPQELIGPYLDEIVTSLHISLDGWRFHNQPAEEVELALDALIALWVTAQKDI